MRSLKISIFSLAVSALLLGISSTTMAQPKKGEHKKEASTDGFKKTASGLEYKIIVDTHGEKKPKVGDYIEIHIHTHVGDSVLFDSRVRNNNQPVPFQIPALKKGVDPTEGFMMLAEGDSAVLRVPVDSIKKMGQQLPPFMKSGMMLEYDVVMVSVKTAEEMKKEADAKAAAQAGIDDKTLQDYFAKNNIHPMKTASGLYYTISSEGTGANPMPGQKVTVNYKGKNLDGVVFDTNMDSSKHHMQPFDFTIGRGQVIKGWDEGIALFKKGGKGTLYIPSTLAYGARGAGGGQIQPNACLIFDVDVLNIADAAAPAPRPNKPTLHSKTLPKH